MSNYPLLAPGRATGFGGAGFGGADPIYLAKAGSAHTMGAFTELVAATPHACDAVLLQMTWGGADVAGRILVDLAIGPAGSEVVVASRLFFRAGAYQTTSSTQPLPLALPAGVRVSARFQYDVSNVGAPGLNLVLLGRSERFPVGVRAAEGVANAATTDALTVPVSYGFGAWTEAVASLTRPIAGVLLAAHAESFNPTVVYLQLGVGGAGAEVAVTPPLLAAQGFEVLALPLGVAAGARLAIRAHRSAAANGRVALTLLYR